MRRTLLGCLAFAVTFAFALVGMLPGRALAAEGDYAIDELSCEIAVQTDGAAHVIERQVVTFEVRNTGYIWYLHVPEDGESVRIAQVRVAPVDDGGTVIGEWTRLQLIDSRPASQGAGPGDSAAPSLRSARTQPWYSYNIGDGMVRCYFPTDDTTTYLIEADYTVAHRVRVYRDVAELYWRYANSSLPADAYDVNLQIMLPVPEEALPTSADGEVVAWGHGPDEGTFAVNEDGTVTYHVDRVRRGNYAEAHVMFPASWVSNLPAGAANTFTEVRRTAALAEEAQWVDASMRGETWDFEVRVLFLGLAVVVILGGVAAVARWGRSPRSRRALVRVAATLGIVALGEQLFFREPVTTAILAGIALVVACASLMLPAHGEDAEQGDEEGAPSLADAEAAEAAAEQPDATGEGS